MDTIVLASASPRRAELLRQIRLPFVVLVPSIHEEAVGATPDGFARKVAKDKAMAVFERIRTGRYGARADAVSQDKLVLSRILDSENVWILGADTLIDLDGAILGKPDDEDHARRMIEQLSGRDHTVITGLCLIVWRRKHGTPEIIVDSVTTSVHFTKLLPEDIERYILSRDWQDAAGSYRIQSLAEAFIDRIEGSYSNVVGLPLQKICGILSAHGYFAG